MQRRILVANRGEIAVRVLRGIREMGHTGVAVHSEVDRAALHVAFADEAYGVSSYLNAAEIVALALERRCDAIHPGYGFLSENASFARMVREAGITFIGPSPEAMEMMGSKLGAKDAAKKHNVPLVPGTEEAITNIS
mgnify:CR=1 FL=1